MAPTTVGPAIAIGGYPTPESYGAAGRHEEVENRAEMSKPTEEQRAADKAARMAMVEDMKSQMMANAIKVILGTDQLRNGVDKWIQQQNDPSLDRMEAIRRLVELGLKAKSK